MSTGFSPSRRPAPHPHPAPCDIRRGSRGRRRARARASRPRIPAGRTCTAAHVAPHRKAPSRTWTANAVAPRRSDGYVSRLNASEQGMKDIALFGSTGSIGRNTLEVIRTHPETFRARYLSAYRSHAALVEQVREFRPAAVAVVDPDAFRRTRDVVGGITE